MKRNLLAAALIGLSLAAGPTLVSAHECQRRCCCEAPSEQRASRGCHTGAMPSGCAMGCADGYAGVGRYEASPLRITKAPLRKPFVSVSAAPSLAVPLVVPVREILRRGSAAAHVPKRYLLACNLRL